MTLDPNPALSPTPLLDGLNPAQAKAATHPSGPLLIVAGPGSGKTRVIAHRIAWLVQEQGVRPHQILGVTFTKKAARELRDRVTALVGQSTEGMSLGTFHSTCARILRVDGAAIGIPREFVIYDDADQDLVIRRALADLRIDPKHYGSRTVRSAISRAKNEGLPVAEYRNRAGNYFEEVVGRLYEHYEATLKQNNALDFDDLLTRTVDLFDTQAQVAERYQRRFRHTLVDEFQDTNLIQYDLTRHWAAGSNNLTVVGDPDQSIYSWRAADIRNILYFERDFPDAAVVRLEQNYRSTKAILRVADAVIDRATERIHKQLWTDNDQGVNPVVYEAYSESDEADFVTQEIERNISEGNWSPGDVAIMYRTNAQSRVIEEAFLRRGIPYRVVGGTRFYARREVKDILAYLRLISNPTDTVAFQRIINVPARALGQKSQGELLVWAEENGLSPLDAAAYAGQSDGPNLTARAARACLAFAQMIQDAQEVAKTGTLEEVIDILLRETGYQDFLFRDFDDAEDRWQNVLELRTVASNYTEIAPEAALATFLEDVALVADVDSMGDDAPQAVTLITLHAAKGLEFPVVFLVGMEEGVLPHQRSFDDPASMEEERRLCYVGCTRAEKQLYLVHAFRRALAGSAGHNPRSRFIDDLNEDHIDLRGRHIKTGGEDVRPARNRWLTWDEMDNDKSGGGDHAPTTTRVRNRSADGRHDGVDADWDSEPIVRVPLSPGDRVRHEAFGLGAVVATKDRGGDSEVTVDFEDAGIKKLLLSLAPLEKV